MMKEADVTQCRNRIAERIRERRRDLRLTQEELAERADLSANYIARLELGSKTPSLSTMVRLAKALDISESDLLASGAEGKWLDELHEIANALNDLPDSDAEYLIRQLRADIDHMKKRRDT